MLARVARARVPLGFVCAAVVLALARPSWLSWRSGLAIAILGELIRLWAAGHLEKGREITTSGPYRFMRHPLYSGSALIGAGFSVAANSVIVAAITFTYLVVTLTAAVRTEEARLDEKFAGAYSDYRAGMMASVSRAYSWMRAGRNGEHRAVLGLMVVFAFLAWRVR